MELTDDMLRKIATHIADLRLRLGLLEQMVTHQSPISEEFEKNVTQAVEDPEYRAFCDQIFEQLKGDPSQNG